jgi:hypothetical protein
MTVTLNSEELIKLGYPREMVEDDRVDQIWHHMDGFVANSYKWPAPGTREIADRVGDDEWALDRETYDRKRSRGGGPVYAAKSVCGGHLRF